MDPEFREELAWLTRALRAQLEWSLECGTHAVPAADEAWLEQRREEYRRAEPAPDLGPAASATDRSPTDETADVKSPADEAAADPSEGALGGLAAPPSEGLGATRPSRLDSALPAAALASPPQTEAKTVLGSFGGSEQGRSPAARSTETPSIAARSTETPSIAARSTETPSIAARSTETPSIAAPSTETPSIAARSTETPSIAARSTEAPSINRQQRLHVLEEKARSCTRCGLHRERTQAVFARGTGSSGLAFVGEGPGADEDAQGYPFVGKAGQLLDRMIAAMGFERDEVYVCNIVKCRPPNNRKPEADEIAACRPFVVEQLELVEPQVIVALGATAVQGLLGVTLGITRLRGQWRLYEGRVPVMPTFHPAYLLRQPAAKRVVWEDLQQVLKQMQLPLPQRR